MLATSTTFVKQMELRANLKYFGSDWIRSVQNGLNLTKLVQIGSNQIKLVHIGSNWFKLVQIGSNWFKSDQSELNEIDWNKLGKT